MQHLLSRVSPLSGAPAAGRWRSQRCNRQQQNGLAGRCCRLKLTQRLKQQLDAAGTPGAALLDLAKAAKLLRDIQAVAAEVNLAGIEVLDVDDGFLATTGQQVRLQAQVGANG